MDANILNFKLYIWRSQANRRVLLFLALLWSVIRDCLNCVAYKFRHLFFTAEEAGMSRIKLLGNSAPAEGLHPVWWMITFTSVLAHLEGAAFPFGISSRCFSKDINSDSLGSVLITQSVPKVPLPSPITFGGRISTRVIRKGLNILSLPCAGLFKKRKSWRTALERRLGSYGRIRNGMLKGGLHLEHSLS